MKSCLFVFSALVVLTFLLLVLVAVMAYRVIVGGRG